ncbi:MAG: AAA family ATPase [Patescibacteria group bacterium]
MPDAPKEILEEVSREYEESLVIPAIKSSPQWMLMPVGLVGSGKTTVVKPLTERFGLVRMSTDEVRQKLIERGYSYEGCRDIIHELSKKYLDLGYSLAIDANTGSRAGIEYNEKTAKVFPNVRQIFIYVNPPEEFIVNKLKNYKHTWLFSDGEHAVQHFYENKRSFSQPNLPFVYEFDTSRNDLTIQIDEAVIVIKKVLGK